MLVYRGDFIFKRDNDPDRTRIVYSDPDHVHEIYLNILLFNRINRVKNIQNDKYNISVLALNFSQIGITISSSVVDIKDYYGRFKRPSVSLFKYMCHFKENYKCDDNKNPYFIIDYEFNTIRNAYIASFEDRFSYLRSISRSPAKATYSYKDLYKKIKPNYGTPKYYIMGKSVFDNKSAENSKLGMLYYDVYFKPVEGTVSLEDPFPYFLYKHFRHQGLTYEIKTTINVCEYDYPKDSQHNFLKLWKVLYERILYKHYREIKIVKLIDKNNSEVKVYKSYFIEMPLCELNKKLHEILSQYINDSKFSKLEFLENLDLTFRIHIDDKIFKTIIKKYNSLFNGYFVLNDILVQQISLYPSKINVSLHLGWTETEGALTIFFNSK